MLIYSRKIIKFIQSIKISVKDILAKEVGLKVHGDRFYNKNGTYSYPIKVVIFNSRPMLGYFDPHFYELGFNECLMRAKKEVLQDIIKHEIAHYMTFIDYGNWVEPHGAHFRAFCQQMGWNQEVQKATTCLDDALSLPCEEENSVLRKVQKLMALATSSNEHEAEAAMIKSQQLLLKYNLEFNENVDEENEKIFLKRIMKQNKKNAKMRAIAHILETFFVSTIYLRNKTCVYLEVVGSATNVEIAGYAANFLEHKLDDLWNQTKKRLPQLKGLMAKNSFFLGVAKGYCNKILFLKRQYDQNTCHGLILIEKKLKDGVNMVYERLTKGSSRAGYCHQSASLGELAGQELNIHPAVGQQSKCCAAYLSFNG